MTHQSETVALTHLITPHYMRRTTTPQQPIGNLTTIYVLSAYLTSANTWHRGEDKVPISRTLLLISCQHRIISWCSCSSAVRTGGQQQDLEWASASLVHFQKHSKVVPWGTQSIKVIFPPLPPTNTNPLLLCNVIIFLSLGVTLIHKVRLGRCQSLVVSQSVYGGAFNLCTR